MNTLSTVPAFVRSRVPAGAVVPQMETKPMAVRLADPAHPAFPRLPRQQQAVVYAELGWSRRAIAQELGCHHTAIRYWLDPKWRASKKADALARHHARKAAQRAASNRSFADDFEQGVPK